MVDEEPRTRHRMVCFRNREKMSIFDLGGERGRHLVSRDARLGMVISTNLLKQIPWGMEIVLS